MDGRADASARRKADHLRVVLQEDVAHAGLTTGLEMVRLAARALPGHDLAEVNLSCDGFGRRLSAPVLISCMTGGTSQAGTVNLALAEAAQARGVALGLGSGRVLLEGGDPTSFQVRRAAPDVLLLANLGAVQLPDVGLAGCRDLVERTGADVLVLHLNAVQEAVQPGGDTGFGGLLGLMAGVVAGLEVPVVVKEVGFGMAPADIHALVDIGVAGVDIAGAGGTNWARVEGHRDPDAALVAAAFADWGWPTARCLVEAAAILAELIQRNPGAGRPTLIGSGGLANGVDGVKALCLGADLVGFGRRLLGPAANGPAEADRHLGALITQMRVAIWALGETSPAALGAHNLVPQAPGPHRGSSTR